MFGVVRPCRHRLSGQLFGEWMGHLCGLCLTLRDLHGQFARLVTNYDGLLVSVLTQAQNPGIAPHRTAGPCPLRGFRRADVLDASGAGAQLAAAVSLVLAAGKIADHVEDADGAFARPLVASGAGVAARRWQAVGSRVGAAIGFDTSVLTAAIGRQAELERVSGLALNDVTEPTESAVSAAFAHTAVLAGRPRNSRPLAEAGRRFGRIAHLLDAVEDFAADREAGAYNPLLATGTSADRARDRCEDALAGLRLAIAGLDLDQPALAHTLLVNEVDVAVGRTFRQVKRGAGVGCAREPGWTGGSIDLAGRRQLGAQYDPGVPGGPGGPGVPGDSNVPGGQFGPGGQYDPSGFGRVPGPGPGRRRSSCWDCCDCCDCGDCCGNCDCGDCDCGGCDCGC